MLHLFMRNKCVGLIVRRDIARFSWKDWTIEILVSHQRNEICNELVVQREKKTRDTI